MNTPTLPTHEECCGPVNNGTATKLQQFIYDSEPAGESDERCFREGLQEVLLEAVTSAQAEVRRLQAQGVGLIQQARKADNCLRRIEDTTWGYDGDCGVTGLANEGRAALEIALASSPPAVAPMEIAEDLAVKLDMASEYVPDGGAYRLKVSKEVGAALARFTAYKEKVTNPAPSATLG